MENTDLQINKSIRYLEEKKYLSYDVFDALNSNYLNFLLKRNIFLRRVAIQVNARLPFNVRPMLGVKKMIHTKTISDLLSIYTMMYKRTNDDRYKVKAFEMYEMLWERRITVEEGFGWGLNFPYSTRFTNADKQTPNLYNTINATHSIIYFYEAFHSVEIEVIIDAVLYFILQYLGVVEENETTSWLRYYPKQTGMPTPNVNATSASLFVRINSLLENRIEPTLIVKLLNFVKTSQNNDGSWFYTTTENGKWIDGFHTGFILESLALIKFINPQYEVKEMLSKGTQFFLSNLIDSNNIPKYFHTSTYPIESQNCAQCIQTLAKLILYDNQDLEKKLNDTISVVNKNLYDKKGYFYHKKGKYITNKNYYARWSQTPMVLSFLFSLNAQKNEKYFDIDLLSNWV
jgi:hypothetical protein